VHEFAQRLDATGVPHEVLTCPGAPYSCFNQLVTEFAHALADAWGGRLLRCEIGTLSPRVVLLFLHPYNICDDIITHGQSNTTYRPLLSRMMVWYDSKSGDWAIVLC
jgi:hypothetical protein